jgi:hypothetical protein
MVLALHLGQVFENSFQGRGKKGLKSGREADFCCGMREGFAGGFVSALKRIEAK